MAYGVLHEGVGGHDEIPGEPATEPNGDSSAQMLSSTQLAFTEHQGGNERALQKEREHALHGQGLTDNAGGVARKSGPVGAELKLHGYAGNDAHDEIHGENLGPETRGAVI